METAVVMKNQNNWSQNDDRGDPVGGIVSMAATAALGKTNKR